MTKKAITLPSGNRVTLANYVKAWKALKALTPEQRAAIRDYNWNWHANDGETILREMRRGIHDRINQKANK